MQMGMGMGGGGPQGFDAAPAYKHEKEELQMAQHSWVLEDAELQLCGAAVAARVVTAKRSPGADDAYPKYSVSEKTYDL